MYLDTLTQAQTLATCVVDLGVGYMRYHGYDDFVDQCAALAIRYYPHGARSLGFASLAAWHCFGQALKFYGNPPKEQVSRYPELQRRRDIALGYQNRLDELGHEDIPADKYARWLRSVEAEKNRLESHRLTTEFRQTIRAK